MELMAVLGAAAQPGIEAEVPDASDPATAAAFTELLAGLVALPLAAPPVADPSPTDAATGGRPAAAVAAVAVVPAVAAEATDLELPAPAGHADPVPPGPTAPTACAAGTEAPPAPAQPGSEPESPTEPGLRPEVSSAPRTESVDAAVGVALPTGSTDAGVDAAPAAGPMAPDVAPTATDVLPRRPVPAPARAQAPATASPATEPVMSAATVRAATAAAATAGPADHDDPASEPRRVESAEATRAAAPSLGGPARSEGTGISPPATEAAHVPGARTLERALAAQLVERVGTLRHRDDGDYELTLQLDPADLGRLELRVRLEGGVVHVQVGAQAAGTGDLLRRALPELREALVDAGLTAGTLDIGPHTGHDGHAGAGGSSPDEPATGADPSVRSRPTPRVAPVPLPIRVGADRGVDVLL